METETTSKIEQLEEKIDAIYDSVEKTRKYFLVMMWVSLAVVVLPALGLIFAIPAFINSYTASFEGLL
ncbi:hypothetical protein KC851_02575 [Candidatus Kaiserbacteria bacterium]|nr:hypothetical protein [Candidatus Kaiserbacteria bacterium]